MTTDIPTGTRGDYRPVIRTALGATLRPTVRGRSLAVIPAYNEEATLARVIGNLREHAGDVDVVVVDDGSTDRTAEVAQANGARRLRHPFNLGIGGAVQSGFKFALENGYDYCVQVDADGQHDPREIAKLGAAMDAHPETDMVVGSRFLTDDYEYPAPVSRRTGIHVFA